MRETISPTNSGPWLSPISRFAAAGPISDLRKHFNAMILRFRTGSP